MKKIFVSLLTVMVSTVCFAQDFDPIAIKILDRMSDIIGDLSSCRYTVNISKDLKDFDFGQITRDNTHEVYLVGPDKMLINSNGDNGHREYWYNGTVVTYYNFDENNYAEIQAPSNIIATIDTINLLYGIDFPASDFLYPTFTDDLMSSNDKISYAGKSEVDGEECFHIIADSKDMTAQFWISNDATMLPKKMVINYKSDSKVSRYEATFSSWQLNPVLPDAMFDFLPPASANNITMLPKK
jgi:hypothetical protein